MTDHFLHRVEERIILCKPPHDITKMRGVGLPSRNELDHWLTTPSDQDGLTVLDDSTNEIGKRFSGFGNGE